MEGPAWGRRLARVAAVVVVVSLVGGLLLAYFTLSVCGCSKRAPPQIESSAVFHPSNDTLVVTHEGGSAFDANDTVEVHVTDGGGSVTPTDHDAKRRVDPPFGAGDTVAVSGVEHGEAVALVAVDEEYGHVVLAYHDVPPERE